MAFKRSNLNLNLRSKLKERLVEESQKKNKKDPRFLNYYDMKEGEKMRILLIPDVNGEIWAKWKMHGPNLKNPKIGQVACSYHSSGEECPVCVRGFEIYETFKETNDEAYKTEAMRWFAKDYVLVSVIVLDSPIEVQESPDGNAIKLMYLPHAVEKMITNQVLENQIGEDDLPLTPIVLKKTKNAGGYASYDSSYFERKTIADDDLDFLENFKVEQFDYTDLDVIPKPSTTKEVRDWLDKVDRILGEVPEEEEKEPSRKDTPTRSEKSSRAAEPEPQDDQEPGPDSSSSHEGEEEEPAETPVSKAASLRERLQAARGSK